MTQLAYIDDFTEISLIDREFNKLAAENIFITNQTETIQMHHERSDFDIHHFKSESNIPLNDEWWLVIDNDVEIPVFLGKVVRSSLFDQTYKHEETIYGALYNQRETTFNVWSPVAKQMTLCLDDEYYPMNYTNGNWSITVPGDHHYKPYIYIADIHHSHQQIVDPYAKGLTVNSTAAVVVDSKVAPKSFYDYQQPSIPPAESIIYEIHVRDLTMHPNSGTSDQFKGKFAGVIETNTHTKNGFSTGFDYIRSLGITHVELLPINDFARVDDIEFTTSYNWGYDPMYFQTPDGSYSVDPYLPELRIEELKQLVMSFHQAGMGVILDVVFNHVFDRESSSFEQLVPGYFFRYHDDLTLSNGTGVGNDFASERAMGRKFILDTVSYYAEVYRVDGFRFDLMGAIDIETMRQIEQILVSINPQVLLLGEGWNLNTALPDDMKTIPTHGGLIPHIHFFNDFFRDTLKGNNFDLSDTGYMTGRGRYYERMFKLFRGEFFDMHVQQSINYTEVHDNHTLFDRIHYTMSDKEYLYQIHQMTTIFTILSQGIPFLHAGQEFFRTKHGHGNTYNLSDIINRIDWNRREKHRNHIETIKKAIQLKRTYEVFRMTDYQDIMSRIIEIKCEAPVFGALLFDVNKEFIVLFNPSSINHRIDLPRLGVFNVELSNTSINGEISDVYHIQPFECVVLSKPII